MTTGKPGMEIMERVKDDIIAAVQGAGDVAQATMDTISRTARIAIRDTAEVGGDIGATAIDLVTGSIEAAKELGVSAEDAAAAAAHGALKAAEQLGSTALEVVRHCLTGTISGVKIVLKVPFKGKGGK